MPYPDPPTSQERYRYQCSNLTTVVIVIGTPPLFTLRALPISRAETLNVVLAPLEVNSGYWLTDAGTPNSDAWENEPGEPWRLWLVFPTAPGSNLRARARAARFGTIPVVPPDAGPWTGWKVMTDTMLWLDMDGKAWGASCTDRLGVEVQFQNLDTNPGSFDILVGNYDGPNKVQNGSLILSPIVPNNGTCITPPSAGRLVNRHRLSDLSGRLVH